MKYTLTLTSVQMAEINKSVELLMRLKLGQYQELIYTLCNIHDEDKQEIISLADETLKNAFHLMNRGKKPNEYKDNEWFVLYDLYQVLRKAIHDAERPDVHGTLDDTEPMQFSKEPLAKCKWTKKG